MDIRIVLAEESHLPAAGDIAVKAWTPIREVFRRELGDELYEAQFTGWQQSKRDAIAAEWKVGTAYVAMAEERVVGFIACHLNAATKTGQIGTNAVDPDFRGQGIGPKMYEFVLQKMKEAGMKYASVITGLDDGHAPARKAYEKAGFEKGLPSIRYYKEL